MNCSSCFKSSKESKKNWKCWKGSSKEGKLRKRKWRRMYCLCGGKLSKDEEQLKNKGGGCCFFRKKLSKDEASRKRGKCDTGDLCCIGRGEEESSRKRRRRSLCCFSCIGCSSKESSRRKGEGCLSCFCCGKSSTEEREGTSKKKVKSKCCIPCFKSSKEEESRKKEERPTSKSTKDTMCCIPCFKLSNKDESGKKGERSTSKSLKKRTCCFPCFKVSDKKESRKRGDKSTSTSPRAKFSKCRFLDTVFCSCFNKANKNMKATSGKKILCWKRKGKKKMNHQPSKKSNSDNRMNNSATEGILHICNGNLAARVFTYNELAAATQKFKPEFQLGKGGFGRVYKGKLEDKEQAVAVKQLQRNENQGNREFLYEVLMLSLLNHPNLISLRGYCVEGDERLLVYDYMPLGSLQDHLLDLSPHSKPLDWNTRMKIAAGAAKGLQFLHDVAYPPVIYGDLKASNILFDQEYNPKLSDFGIAKVSPNGAKRVMGTGGYCAPEYALTGKLTKMSDIYSFGIVLLELITGRKAMDSTRPSNEQRLVDWALVLFKDEKRLIQLADPLLEGNFSMKALYQAIAVAAQCLQVEDTTRPQIKDVLSALESLTVLDSENSMKQPEAFGPQGSVLPGNSHIEETSEHTEEEDEDEEVEDGNPSQSSRSDWQSCSTVREEEE